MFYSPLVWGYIRKVIVHLVAKYFPYDCSNDSLSCSRKKRESDENNIRTRKQLDRNETVLLLEKL